jgi:hypothetical protein
MSLILEVTHVCMVQSLNLWQCYERILVHGCFPYKSSVIPFSTFLVSVGLESHPSISEMPSQFTVSIKVT